MTVDRCVPEASTRPTPEQVEAFRRAKHQVDHALEQRRQTRAAADLDAVSGVPGVL